MTRILLCATGMSPQIVTETLYALAVKPAPGKPVWIPDEIHLISTATGANQARLNLLSQTPGWFHKLRSDYHLPEIKFTHATIHCIQDAQGVDLEDIRTPADNEAAANSIAELVRQLTQDPHSELHVSLAGGRKTMGYYSGYALSLYGRPQDTLSHILVSGAFEGHPSFYYPTPHSSIIQTRGDKPQALDCADAMIELAEIPFVRLRDGLPQRLLDGKANFTETVEVTNLAQGEAHLCIHKSARNVTVNGLLVSLTETQFTLLLWFAQRALGDHPEIRWSDYEEWHDNYLPLLIDVYGNMHTVIERAEKALPKNTDYDPQIVREYFQPTLSKLKKALKDHLGGALASRCAIQKTGKDKANGYCLPADLKITID
jgi:CRISPR-associated protein (TIGR02584 family)